MTSHRILTWVTVAAVISSSVAHTAGAQRSIDGLQDSIPRALAEALVAPSSPLMDMMRYGDGGRPRLIVGSLPAALVERLWLPPAALVLGGVESSNAAAAFMRSNLALDTLAAAYRREQLSRGWTAPPAIHSSPIWGFLPATPTRSESSERLLFCSGDSLLTIHIAPIAAGVREITAGVSAIEAATCRASLADAQPWRAMRRNHPTLTNPPETSTGRRIDCADWSMSRSGGETHVSTPLSVEEVLAHYGAQLADSGWTVGAADEMVTRTWTRRDSTGAFVDLTLTARRRPRTQRCVSVEMRVTTRTVR